MKIDMPKHKFKITKSMMIFAVLVLAVLFDVQCQAETPRGYAGISIGDSVEQVTLRIGELKPAICEVLCECCNCGAYFTIVRKPTIVPRSGIKCEKERDFCPNI
jgi:hypothetical protein